MAFAIDILMNKSRDELVELARHRGSQIRGNASKDSLIVEHIRLNQAEADSLQSESYKNKQADVKAASPRLVSEEELREALKRYTRITLEFSEDQQSCTIYSVLGDKETCSLYLPITQEPAIDPVTKRLAKDISISAVAKRLNAWLTEDEVRKELSSYPGLIVEIRDDGRTCSLISRGCEESVSMSSPISMIRSVASRLGAYPQANMIKGKGNPNDLAETVIMI